MSLLFEFNIEMVEKSFSPLVFLHDMDRGKAWYYRIVRFASWRHQKKKILVWYLWTGNEGREEEQRRGRSWWLEGFLDSLRKGVCVIWVPLFFCVSLTICLTLYSSLEFWNSVHSDFCNLSNSVMAFDMQSRRAERLLEEYDGENCNGEEEV